MRLMRLIGLIGLILYLVAFCFPVAEGLQSFVAHESFGRDGTLGNGAFNFFVYKFVAEIDVLGILFRVSKANAAESGPIDGAQTHGAGFAGSVDGTAFQLERVLFLTGGTDSRDFGMCCRVVIGGDAVDTCGNDLAVLNDDGTERASSVCHVLNTQVDGLLHEKLVLIGHRANRANGAYEANGAYRLFFLAGACGWFFSVLYGLLAYGFVKKFLKSLDAAQLLVLFQYFAVPGMLLFALALLYGKGMQDFVGCFAANDIAYGKSTDAG